MKVDSLVECAGDRVQIGLSSLKWNPGEFMVSLQDRSLITLRQRGRVSFSFI